MWQPLNHIRNSMEHGLIPVQWWRQSLLILCLLLLFIRPALSQVKSASALEAMDYLDTRNEVYLRTALPSAEKIATISSIVSIDKITENYIYLYANRDGFEEFEVLDLKYEVLVPPSLKNFVKMSTGNWKPGDFDVYPTFGEYVAVMQQFALDYPDICMLDTIGFSTNSRPILVVKISDQVAIDEPEPDFFYSSTMHGDELPGYVLLIRLIDYMLKGYDSIPKVTEMVDQLQIRINPLANPDGTYINGDHTVIGATRSNSDGKDLNRDFPEIDWGEVPKNFSCQPETKDMMEFMAKHPPVMSANIHAGAELVNYPWDAWPARHADDDWFRFVSREYADTVHLLSHSNPAFDEYFTHEDNGITNGHDWYYAPGTRQDYITYYQNGREVTLEISLDKVPPARQLPLFWEYNYRSLLNYMQQCMYGFRGTITDIQTDAPIRAKISVVDHDKNRSGVWSDSVSGQYFRPIRGGEYDLEFTAPGYLDKRINNLFISDFLAVEIDVQLEINPASTIELNENSLNVRPLTNPFNESLRAAISSARQVTAHYCLVNLYGQQVTRPEKTIIYRGDNVILLNTSGLRPGYYILNISIPSRDINTVVVKM